MSTSSHQAPSTIPFSSPICHAILTVQVMQLHIINNNAMPQGFCNLHSKLFWSLLSLKAILYLGYWISFRVAAA